MLHIRAHIYELEMWQKVKKLASLFTLTAVQFEICAYDIRNSAVGVAVEWGPMFLKMTYGMCGRGSTLVCVIPAISQFRRVCPTTLWGHSVVCVIADEFGLFHWNTPVRPKLRHRKSMCGKSLCISWVSFSDHGVKI